MQSKGGGGGGALRGTPAQVLMLLGSARWTLPVRAGPPEYSKPRP